MTRRDYFLGRIRGERILDVGGADGTLHQALAERFPGRVWLLDLRPAVFPRSVQGDARECDRYFSVPFDTLVAGEVVEHLEQPDEFLRAAIRILQPGGTLLMSTPNRASWCNRLFRSSSHAEHRSLHTPEEWRDRVSSAGFTIRDCRVVAYAREANYYDDRWWCRFSFLLFPVRRLLNAFLPPALREQILVEAVRPP